MTQPTNDSKQKDGQGFSGDIFGEGLYTLKQLASALDRKPEGLRASLYADNKTSRRLRAARIRIGRRVYFRGELLKKLYEEACVEAHEIDSAR